MTVYIVENEYTTVFVNTSRAIAVRWAEAHVDERNATQFGPGDEEEVAVREWDATAGAAGPWLRKWSVPYGGRLLHEFPSTEAVARN